MKVRIPPFTLLAFLLAVLWGGTLALSHWRGSISILDRIEAPLTDLRFLIKGPRDTPDSIVIVAIDDETVKQAGSYPLPRAVIAQLVEEIRRFDPKVIALDLLFLDPGSPDGDQALSASLTGSRSILAAAGIFDHPTQTLFDKEKGPLGRIPIARNLFLPIQPLLQSAAVGTVNVATDPSGIPRHVPLLLRTDDRVLPSFSLRAASIAEAHAPRIEQEEITLNDRTIKTDFGYALPLRFYGPRGSVRTISANDVLKKTLDPEAIHGKVVVVGVTVTGGGDVFPTPFDPVLPGVEVMATAIAHLMAGDSLVRDWRVRLADATVAVILPGLAILLLAWHRITLGFIAISAVVLFWLGLTAIAFTYGIWLSASLPLVAVALPAILFGASCLWMDRRRAENLAQESRVLRTFQPPSLAEQLKRDPNFLAQPVTQKAALIFIDLSGFTGMSEILDPSETREVISSFHALVDEEAMRCHGLVACFMGDGAMIVFGLPEPSSKDACHAVEACIGLCSRTQAWLASLPKSISSRLGFKIGAHYGVIVASRLGGDSHHHITATGDTVNVASRLMEVAALHHADLALSEDLFIAAGDACAAFSSGMLGETFQAAIRGRKGSLKARLWRSGTAIS